MTDVWLEPHDSEWQAGERVAAYALHLDARLAAYGHQGALVGQSTWALSVPERDTVIVFSSTMSGSFEDLAMLATFLQ